jgi:CubicO group peptidase (beta-lactamase class C family)
MKCIHLICLFFISQLVVAQSQQERYDSLFNYLEKQDDFSGSVLIADKGKIIYQKSFGYSNFATKDLANSESMFDLASVTKQFTAMGILILKERGKLKLEDPLTKYLKTLPYSNITIRHLLTHTSGVPDYLDLCNKHWDKSKIAFNKDIIDLFARVKPSLQFSPGENFEYSNTGYLLLASIIEKASGLSFADFMKKNIFKPLKMGRTRIYNSRRSKKEIIQNYAYGYIITDSLKVPTLPDSFKKFNYVFYVDGVVGDGAISSSAPDLLKWDQALYTDKLVKNSTLQEAFIPFKSKDGKRFGYGFGWGLSNDSKTGKSVYHRGGGGGYDTYISRFIDTNKTIIVLRNITNQNKVAGVYEAYTNILFDKPFTLPTIEKSSK